MKSYYATYVKKNGDIRNMHFAKLNDLPSDFVSSRIKGGNQQHNLDEGMELVWDLQNKGFRIFNWKTVEGAVKEEEVEFVL